MCICAGSVQRAIPVLERAMGSVPGLAHSALFARESRSPGHGVCAGRAYRRGSGASGTEGRTSGRRAQREVSGVCGRLSQRSVSAGGPPGRGAPTRGSGSDLARQYQQRGKQAWALWLLGERTARQASPAGRVRRRPLPPGPRPGQGAGHAPAPGALPPWPRTLYARTGQRQQARAALAAAIDLYRDMAMTFWLPQAEAVLAQVG